MNNATFSIYQNDTYSSVIYQVPINQIIAKPN